MSDPRTPIVVKSHVARDLLQTASLFKTDRAVVGEYVANSMEYVDDGVVPVINVLLDGKNRRIAISDNGRGMDRDGLANFFLMHGENQDRKRGQGRRGVFGTGKSAAFGIANVLRITTTRGGRRWCVELRRNLIRSMTTDAPIPVREIEANVPTSLPNGTIVEIEEVTLKSLDQAGIIRHIERNLSGWVRSASIVINGHECEFKEPPSAEVLQFVPDAIEFPLLAGSTLVVKVSPLPLESDEVGVSVTSGGVLYERTLAGNEGRPMSDYLFGQFEIAALQSDESPVAAFDQSRSMRLNAENPIVSEMLGFVGGRLDQVRRDLVRKDKARRATEEAKAWAARAKEIEEIINADFSELSGRISRVRSKVRGVAPSEGGFAGGNDAVPTPGLDYPSDVTNPLAGGPGATGDGRQSAGDKPRSLAPELERTVDGEPSARDLKGSTRRAHASGGFAVEFQSLGVDARRAVYQRDRRVICVNLDHPQLVAARGDAPEPHLVLRRLAFEVAFTEYAIALASEFAAQDQYIDLTDPIVDIRDSINRLAVRAASLYRPIGNDPF